MTISKRTMDDSDALFDKAIAFHQSGKLGEARSGYESLLDADPGNSALHHVLGVVCYQQREYVQAEQYLRSAIELDAGQASYHSNLGLTLVAQGHRRQAIRAFEAALALNPDYPDALNNLGGAYASEGRLADAEARYRRLIEILPGSAEGHYNLGVVVLRRGETEAAKRLLARALQLRPDYTDARVSLGRLLFDAGESELAADNLRLALTERPRDPEILRMLALALRSREPAEALRYARLAVTLRPDDAGYHVALGCVQQSRGEFDAAELAYNKALQIDQTDADALNNLGTIFKERDENLRAMACFRAAIDSRPASADAHYNLGTVLQDLGETEEAIRSFERSLEIRPESALPHRCLLDIYRATGRRQRAAGILDRWLKFEPDNATALHMRAALQQADVPSRASDEYVREEFDRFASGFDRKLAKLNYCAPQRLVHCLQSHVRAQLGPVLDAGCGTGLAAALLEPLCDRLDGVDLSPGMIERARERKHYHALFVGELVSFLVDRVGTYDLIFSADTLVYFGDLMPFLRAAARALRSGGYLAVSLEHLADPSGNRFRLNPTGRYCHSLDYVTGSLNAAGFECIEVRQEVLREELNRPVEGLVILAQSAAGTDAT